MSTPDEATTRVLRGAVAAVLLPLAAVLFAAWFVDPVVLPVAHGSRGAAVAIRDRVDETEILLTWAFVRPRLEAAYAEVACITQRQRAFFGPGDQGEAWKAAVTDLAARHPFVDLYLLAHTNRVVDWAEELPTETRAKLRLVYNSGCGGGMQAERWHVAGARAYVAHPETASHAGFFVCFLRRWPGGDPLGVVVAQANDAQDRLFAHLAPLDPSFECARKRWLTSRAVVHGTGDLTLAGGGDG